MLNRRGWFNARSKNWFFCGVSNRQVNGCQKLIWRERKNEFGGSKKIGGNEELGLRLKLIWPERFDALTKLQVYTTSLTFDLYIGIGTKDRDTERQRERQNALTFGGTDGSMLGRRGWFDALSKGIV